MAKKTPYVTNTQLILAIRDSKAKGELSDELAGYILLIAERYSRHPSFFGYSYREDMVADAVLNLVSKWDRFDEDKSDNPFAFYTMAIYRSFLGFLATEKKHTNMKNEMIMDAGMVPAYGFTDWKQKQELEAA